MLSQLVPTLFFDLVGACIYHPDGCSYVRLAGYPTLAETKPGESQKQRISSHLIALLNQGIFTRC
jgi:hypothetical protein